MAASWIRHHRKWQELFPAISPVTLGSSALLFPPIIRDIIMWGGARHVDKKTFERSLAEGLSPILVPGGLAELRLSKSTSKVIELNGRHRGFIRLALRHGTHIVPVYSFGETLTMDTVHVPVLTGVAYRFLKMPFPYFTGLGGFLQVPRRNNITVVFGSPISVEKDEDPSEEKITELHRRFYKETEKLFEDHKHKYGHGEHTLKVLHLQ